VALKGGINRMNKYIKKKFKVKKFIGSGARRLVYDLGNGNVLKVAKSIYGIKSNKTEVIMYQSSPTPLKKYLGKVIDYGSGYDWLIMKKYMLEFPSSKQYKRNIHQVRVKFKKNGILPFECVDRYGNANYQNLRLRDNNKTVIIDYGNFKYR
jgi:hypothetical protein